MKFAIQKMVFLTWVFTLFSVGSLLFLKFCANFIEFFLPILSFGKIFKLCVLILRMSKVSRLQLVKPRFEWDAHDKLTEIKQFNADCKILFEGPLSDLKDREKSQINCQFTW